MNLESPIATETYSRLLLLPAPSSEPPHYKRCCIHFIKPKAPEAHTPNVNSHTYVSSGQGGLREEIYYADDKTVFVDLSKRMSSQGKSRQTRFVTQSDVHLDKGSGRKPLFCRSPKDFCIFVASLEEAN